MSPEDAQEALEYLKQAWPYVPMPDMQARQFTRLFLDWSKPEVAAAIDTLFKAGQHRPGPAQLAERLRMERGTNRAASPPYERPTDAVPMPAHVKERVEALGLRRR